MEILNRRLLAGPNIWRSAPVLEALVDVRSLQALPTEIGGLLERMLVWLSALTERSRVGERGAFVDLLRDGCFQVECLKRVAAELQANAGVPGMFSQVRPTPTQGIYRLALEYEDAALAQACLDSARSICMAAIAGEEFDVAAEIDRLRELADDTRLGPSTRSIVEAAKRRGIPALRMSEGNLVQLGHGARQRRMMAAETDRTSAVAETVAQDKELTRSLLRKIGVPVPLGRSPSSAAEAWRIALELGLPVVVKPRHGNHGRGVATNLTTREQVVAACEAIWREGSAVVVEQLIQGADYRLLVVGNRLVAAARRDPPAVLGDGTRTVAQLVEAVNADPRRAEGHAAPLTKIVMDTIAREVLAEQGFVPESVPAKGTRVLIRRNGNLSTGGTATDVTADVHPAIAARAVEAARMVGLDVAGIDMLADDIGQPLEDQGGAVIEVNACPGLRMHLHPSHGQPRAVGEAIVDLMFNTGETARVPIIAISGDCQHASTSRLVAQLLERTESVVGLSCGEGLFVNRRSIANEPRDGLADAEPLLLHPLVEAAVFQTEPAGVLDGGLPFDRCDVAIIVEVAADDGSDGARSQADLLAANRCLLQAIAPRGAVVFNADDPLISQIADDCSAERIYFSYDEHHPRLFNHRLSGGRIVFLRNDSIMAASGARETLVAPLNQLCLTYGGIAASHVNGALAAVAGCWALGMPMDALRSAITSFVGNAHAAPFVKLPQTHEEPVSL